MEINIIYKYIIFFIQKLCFVLSNKHSLYRDFVLEKYKVIYGFQKMMIYNINL